MQNQFFSKNLLNEPQSEHTNSQKMVHTCKCIKQCSRSKPGKKILFSRIFQKHVQFQQHTSLYHTAYSIGMSQMYKQPISFLFFTKNKR